MRAPKALLAVLCLAAPPAAVCFAERITDDLTLNYALRVPDGWNWGEIPPAFAAQDVVVRGDRVLDKLADGSNADGQGGRVLLSVGAPPASFPGDYETWLFEWQSALYAEKALPEPPEDGTPIPAELQARIEAAAKKVEATRERVEKALEAFAQEADAKRLLLERFDLDPEKWPAVEVDARGVDVGGMPAVRIEAKASCANHAGEVGPCVARMFVFSVRKRLYRLAMWAWPTERDREHVKGDLTEIELAFEVPKKDAIPPKVAPPPDKDPEDGKPAPAVGDSGERKTVSEASMAFSVVKPVKFASKSLDRSDPKDRDTAFQFDAVQGASSATVEMFAFRVSVAGSSPFDLRRYFGDYWASFMTSHPAGAIETYPFPAPSTRNPFLSLPDLAKKKIVKRPDKDAEWSFSDLDKAGVVTESKNASVGKQKVREAVRFAAKGNVERAGDDWWLVWTFMTPQRVYVVRVTVRKDGWGFWKDEITEILRSITIQDEAK